MTIFTPVNLLLLSLALYLLYTRLRPTPPASLSPANPAVVFQNFTPKALQKYNGTDDPRVYIAVAGGVFDVTSGAGFYGPGGSYSNFAGRDASRGLALGSFDDDVLPSVDGPLDDLKDLTAGEKETLSGWVEHFRRKYMLVGKLVSEEEQKEIDYKDMVDLVGPPIL
jgi:membrane-associated progesterone receptor component